MDRPSSPQDIVVPDLVGMKVARARATAQEALLFLEREDPDGPPLASGIVARQTPPAGALVAPFSRVVAWVIDETVDDPDGWDPGDEGGTGDWGPGDWDPGGGGRGGSGPGGGGPPPSGDREPRSPAPLSGAGREHKEAETPVPG